MAQWLRLHHPYAEGLGSISGQGTKIPHATWCGQKFKALSMGVPWWPMVRIPGFHCHGSGSVSGQGTEIPQAARHGPPPTAHRPTHTQKQTNPKPKRTVFAEEIMTTTQLAIKKLCSPGILLTQEKIQLPQGSLLILCPAVVEDLGSEPELLCVSL